VISWEEFNSSKFVESSTEVCNLGIGFKKGLGCKSSQGTNDLGLDRMDLFDEKRITTLDFIGLWIPILGRTTFDDVCDIDLLSLKMDGMKDLR